MLHFSKMYSASPPHLATGARAHRFGVFVLEADQRRLIRGDAPVPLAPRAFDVLLMLVQRAGSLVSKEELLQHVWRDAAVEEANLTVTISAIRRALGAGVVETVHKYGYRFAAMVEPLNPAEQRPSAPGRDGAEPPAASAAGGDALEPVIRPFGKPLTKPLVGPVLSRLDAHEKLLQDLKAALDTQVDRTKSIQAQLDELLASVGRDSN